MHIKVSIYRNIIKYHLTGSWLKLIVKFKNQLLKAQFAIFDFESSVTRTLSSEFKTFLLEADILIKTQNSH